MSKFIHLHNHFENSMFDGCMKLEQAFNKCKRNHMDAIGITDHHNVITWFQALKLKDEYAVKPIYGMEINVGKDHLTAFAMNNLGMENLIKLNNKGYERSGKPKITEKELFEHKEGLFILSGCSNGKIAKLLFKGSYVEAGEAMDKYKEVFGKHFAVEIQHFKEPTNRQSAKQLISMAKERRLPIIPTNDCHYLEKEDFLFHKQLVSMHTTGKSVPKNEENYFKTKEEMREVFPEKALETTGYLSQICQTDLHSYLKETEGNDMIPLAMMYYYTDAEALKKALYAKRNYKLGEFMYKKMVKEDLTLEDLYQNGSLSEEIKFAFGLRDKLYKIEPDPFYYLKVNKEKFPLWRKTRNSEFCAQIDILTAKDLGLEIHDRRKMAVNN